MLYFPFVRGKCPGVVQLVRYKCTLYCYNDDILFTGVYDLSST